MNNELTPKERKAEYAMRCYTEPVGTDTDGIGERATLANGDIG